MRAGTNKRLLVVEDDRPIAELLKHHFTSAGYTVTTTPDGDEALILIEEALPYSLKAKTSWRLADGKLRCTIELPLERKTL